MWLSWLDFRLFRDPKGALGSKVVDLECQDTDWVGANGKDSLHAILRRVGLILAHLCMNKGKCGYLG